MCFIDFDTVKHEILFESLQHLDLDGKDLRIMHNMYWEQTVAVRLHDIGEFIVIKRRVRQGCVWSGHRIFGTYMERR